MRGERRDTENREKESRREDSTKSGKGTKETGEGERKKQQCGERKDALKKGRMYNQFRFLDSTKKI